MTEPRDFLSVVRTQRAHREFTTEPVSDELVEQVLESATFAPSAENTQPWIFIVVRDASARARIGELNRQAWEGGGREFSRPRLTPEVFAKVEAGATGGIANAPVLIVVCGDTSRCVEAVLESSIWPAVQNLLLAANACGLGSALTTITTVFGDELRSLLALPDHVRPLAVVPLGWPARKLGPPRRAPVAEKTCRERYGTTWVR
ncbi:MAG TPA: nitroreductase family protein [Acidimicrobiia bacterium]|nr:nitroreductase family protein [Acidimicrobiia bacterium]